MLHYIVMIDADTEVWPGLCVGCTEAVEHHHDAPIPGSWRRLRRINSTEAYLASPLAYNNGQGCGTPCAKPDANNNGCCDEVWLPSLNFMNTFGLPQVRPC